MKCLDSHSESQGGPCDPELLRSVHKRNVLNQDLKLSLLQTLRIILQHADLLLHPVIRLRMCLTLSAVRVIIPVLCEELVKIKNKSI